MSWLFGCSWSLRVDEAMRAIAPSFVRRKSAFIHVLNSGSINTAKLDEHHRLEWLNISQLKNCNEFARLNWTGAKSINRFKRTPPHRSILLRTTRSSDKIWYTLEAAFCAAVLTTWTAPLASVSFPLATIRSLHVIPNRTELLSNRKEIFSNWHNCSLLVWLHSVTTSGSGSRSSSSSNIHVGLNFRGVYQKLTAVSSLLLSLHWQYLPPFHGARSEF